MTRVGIFSDSHRDCRSLGLLLDKMGYIDAACFLGDVASDAAYLREVLAAMPHEPPLYAVRGNNDLTSALPDELVVELGGKRAYLTHGHMRCGPMSLVYKAQENHAQIALFGHTHIPFCETVQGVLLLNPGSAGRYCRGGEPRASVLEIDAERLRALDVTL